MSLPQLYQSGSSSPSSIFPPKGGWPVSHSQGMILSSASLPSRRCRSLRLSEIRAFVDSRVGFYFFFFFPFLFDAADRASFVKAGAVPFISLTLLSVDGSALLLTVKVAGEPPLSLFLFCPDQKVPSLRRPFFKSPSSTVLFLWKIAFLS